MFNYVLLLGTMSQSCMGQKKFEVDSRKSEFFSDTIDFEWKYFTVISDFAGLLLRF